MDSTDNVFLRVASQVTDASVLEEIIQKQQNAFEVQPYKIEGGWGQNMAKTYLGIRSRHEMTSEGDEEPNNWNQNQRRLFVWFIVCYTYFLQQQQQQITEDTWQQLSPVFFGKTPQFLHFQYLNLLKYKKRVTWTPAEDQLLADATRALKPGKWNAISKKIFYESEEAIFRTPKHCRERWLNHLDENKKHGNWTQEEDLIVFEYALTNGKRWSKIVELLGGSRTQHMIKNRYNSQVAKWRTGKKIKEEEVARKIYNKLCETIVKVKDEQGSDQLQSAQVKDAAPKKEELKLKKEESRQEQRQEEGNVSEPLVVSPVPSSPFGFYMNYNGFYWYNQCFFQNNCGFGGEKEPTQMFPLSRKSSFSSYKPEETTGKQSCL